MRSTGDTAGVSWTWSLLTAINNGAWLSYFALSRYWTALAPSISATVLSATLTATLTRRGLGRPRAAVAAVVWAALLAGAYGGAGRGGLGALLTGAFALQVTPSLVTAYRTARPSGISRGTWLLILGELSCWTTFGVHESDPRLIVLGVTGVTASTLMLARVLRSRGGQAVPAISPP